MYMLAKDLARARTICEYADGRIGRKRLQGPRWAAVISAVEGVESRGTSVNAEATITESVRDLAAAYTTMSRSLRFRKKQSQPSGSESP
jgi:hypothetical protein